MSQKGFFTDTTICIGCKACEVACKQWNQLPEDGFYFSGRSYDNTMGLGPSTWRHVSFVERDMTLQTQETGVGAFSWLLMSDVCKHCERAGCLESCPTGAIVRTEFGNVYVQPDVCNGCGYCVSSCPFGVIDRRQDDGRAWKCTLCYDRLKADLEPACAKTCPTKSIRFGDLEELHEYAQARLQKLHNEGMTDAYLYGMRKEDQPGTEGLHAFCLLADQSEVYNLPPEPEVPTKHVKESWLSMAIGGFAAALIAIGSVMLSSNGGRR
ncbi:MAG: 4Fe-4S dicluster domain-containing protein [Acidobacteriota bacterium]